MATEHRHVDQYGRDLVEGAEIHCAICQETERKRKARNRRARIARQARTEVYRSLGLRRNRDGSWE